MCTHGYVWRVQRAILWRCFSTNAWVLELRLKLSSICRKALPTELSYWPILTILNVKLGVFKHIRTKWDLTIFYLASSVWSGEETQCSHTWDGWWDLTKAILQCWPLILSWQVQGWFSFRDASLDEVAVQWNEKAVLEAYRLGSRGAVGYSRVHWSCSGGRGTMILQKNDQGSKIIGV